MMPDFQLPTSGYWTIRSLVAGRLYFADGTSERFDRGFVWGSLRPRPEDRLRLWMMRLFSSSVERRECGCVLWRGRREAVCGGHLRTVLSGADEAPIDAPIGPPAGGAS